MLAPQIGLVVFAHIMVDQGDRDNERDMALVIMFDNFEQFLLFISGKVLLEIAHQMLQHIGMLLDRCPQLQSLHQLDLIRVKRIWFRNGFCRCHQSSDKGVQLGAVRHNKKLVAGVKIHQQVQLPALLAPSPATV